MEYITKEDILELHEIVISQSGGGSGLRDPQGLEACIEQPLMTFGGEDLYPGIVEKASSLCFSLVMNHPFIDGNKSFSI